MKQLNLLTGQTKEEMAIEFIREHEPKDEPYMLCYSGGKDSIVLEDVARKSGVSYVVYYTLVHDSPEVIQFIKSRTFHINIIKAERNFYQMVETKFPPNRNARWCCDYIKEKPSTKIPLTHRLLGIRAEEGNRAERGWINQITKKRINYHPLFNWLEWEIWEYIDSNHLEYCKLYDEGFSRLGCVVCPLRSYKELMKWKEKYPYHFKLFEKAVARWWNSKGEERERQNGYAQSLEEYLDNWYRGKNPCTNPPHEKIGVL